MKEASGTVAWPADLRTWIKFIAGFVMVFSFFQYLGWKLESARGEYGIVICILIVAATILTDKWLTGKPFRVLQSQLGLRFTDIRHAVLPALIPSLLMIAVIPAVILLENASWKMYPGWAKLLPGLFFQAGIAEETLFRGYLFRHLRQGRTFRNAAVISSIPFVLAHSVLYFTMSPEVATASILLSAIISFPLSMLFEAGGNTVWAPAILHFVIQAAVKIIEIDGLEFSFPIIWMTAAAVIPFVVFLISPAKKKLTQMS